MANLTENAGASFDGVRRIETNDPVMGGDPEIAGVVNSPYNYLAQALVNRDIYLKEAIERLAATVPAAVPDASTTISGKVRLATLPEMRAGTHKTAVATVEGVQEAINQIETPDVSIPDATTAQKGKVELATRAEAKARTKTDVVITPDALDEALDGLPSATESQKGLIERATQTEAETSTDNTRALTALRSMQQLRHSNAQATTTRRGTVELATETEAKDKDNNTKALTAASLHSTETIALSRSDLSITNRSNIFTTRTSITSASSSVSYKKFGPIRYDGSGSISISLTHLAQSVGESSFEISFPSRINPKDFEWSSNRSVAYLSINNGRLRFVNTANNIQDQTTTITGIPK